MARPTRAARRYAEAVFELAQRDGTLDAWMIALEVTGRGLGTDEVLRLVQNPAVPFDERRRAVVAAIDADMVRERIGDPVPAQLENLAGLLLQRRRLALLPAIAAEYRQQLDDARGVAAATVTSATALGQADVEAVRRWVEGMTGATVRIDAIVDPMLIGGLTVQVGDRLIDASVRGRLERLRSQLAAGGRGTTRAGPAGRGVA
jgi:F-type H+-transporting ATPase subunit delta